MKRVLKPGSGGASREKVKDAITAIIVGLSQDGKIVFINRRCEELLGYREEEILGRFFWDFSPEHSKKRVEEDFSNIGGAVASYETPWNTCGGEEHLIRWEFIQFKGSEGHVRMIIAVGNDLTASEMIERKLGELELLYHGLTSESWMGICAVHQTSEGTVLRSVNPRMEEIFGYGRGELEGKKLEDLIHPQDISLVESQIQDAWRGVGKTVQTRGRKKNGEIVWIENRMIQVPQGEQRALIWMVQDVHSLKVAEEQLKEKKIYENIVARAKIGIGVLQNGKVLYMNEGLAEIFECSKRELEKLGFAHFVHPEDKGEIETAREMVKKGIPYTSSYRAITKEGKVKYIHLHVSPVESDGGQAVLLIVEDITEQKETERKLQDREAELRRAYTYLREAEIELRKKTEELRRANEMRAEFLDLLAHEIKSYLTPIEVYVDSIKEGEFGEVSLTQRRRLQEITDKIKKIDRVIEDTLDLSRIEADIVKISRESVFLPDIIESIIEEFRPQIEDKNQEVTMRAPEKLPVVEGDPRLLEKVFRNLISNAIAYTPAGGKITIELSEERECVLTKVSDTGVGIPADELDKIFQKFYRGRDRKTRGLGIGLALARHFVELHGGRIWAESALGVGSTFYVKLPKNPQR